MTLLFLVGAWLLALWLASGLCAAARLGDRVRIEDGERSESTPEIAGRLAA